MIDPFMRELPKSYFKAEPLAYLCVALNDSAIAQTTRVPSILNMVQKRIKRNVQAARWYEYSEEYARKQKLDAINERSKLLLERKLSQ